MDQSTFNHGKSGDTNPKGRSRSPLLELYTRSLRNEREEKIGHRTSAACGGRLRLCYTLDEGKESERETSNCPPKRVRSNLYFWPTPNGKKITIFLEETGLAYRLVPLNIGRGDQFSREFLAINPNHRMPAIVDHDPIGARAPLSVLESGAILMYLAEKSGQLWPQAPEDKYEVVEWVVWQMANQGPKFGECGHFLRAAQQPGNGDLSYSLRRFDNEVNRLYGVLNNRLYDRRYVAGEHYSIADIACYPWALNWAFLKQNIDDFKYVKRWIEDVGSRPAVQRGMDIGEDLVPANQEVPKEEAERRAKILFNQRALPPPG